MGIGDIYSSCNLSFGMSYLAELGGSSGYSSSARYGDLAALS